MSVLIERVLVREDWQTRGHLVAIIGAPMPGARRSVLHSDGEWAPLTENAATSDPDDALLWWHFPAGALDALVEAHTHTAAPTPAASRHLDDAVVVRDRLLALVETLTTGPREGTT